MNFVLKIFLMIFGVIMIALMAVILTNITNQACSPADLFSGEDSVVGFGGTFINSLYDSMCSTFLEANNGVWNAYANWIVGVFGQRPSMANIAGDLWGLASYFCQTHSNFEYASSGSAGAITDTQTFKELFLYEVERCWSMFQADEGDFGLLSSTDNRHPIGKNAIFDCAEIIYDFSEGGGGDYVSFAELLARLMYINSCGDDVNAPVRFYEDVEGPAIIDSMSWCAPKDFMEEYWSSTSKTYARASSLDFSGGSVFDLSCDSGSNPVESTNYTTSACMPYMYAMCSYSSISPKYNNTLGYDPASSDESAVIDGCGRLVISFFDFFDWGALWWYQSNSDVYDSCDYLNIFNGFNILTGNDLNYNNDLWPRRKNSIIFCYEKYDTCDWLQ